MAQQWPASLQQLLSVASFGVDYGDATLRSEMDVGLAKTRNRYTKAIDLINGSILASTDEVAIFKAFYKDTLANGNLPFTFNDPFTQVPTDYKFKVPPKVVPVGSGGIVFTITFQWEELP